MTNQTEVELGLRALVAPRGFVFGPQDYDESFVANAIYQAMLANVGNGEDEYSRIREIKAEKDGVSILYGMDVVSNRNAIAKMPPVELDKLIADALKKREGFCEFLEVSELKKQKGSASIWRQMHAKKGEGEKPKEFISAEPVFTALLFYHDTMELQHAEDKPYDKQHVLYRVNRVLDNIEKGILPADS